MNEQLNVVVIFPDDDHRGFTFYRRPKKGECIYFEGVTYKIKSVIWVLNSFRASRDLEIHVDFVDT